MVTQCNIANNITLDHHHHVALIANLNNILNFFQTLFLNLETTNFPIPHTCFM